MDRLRRVLGWWSVRPALTAAAVYALLAVLMVGQGLLPGRTLSGADGLLSSDPWLSTKPADVPGLGTNYELADTALVLQPFVRHTRAVLPHVPLWNVNIGAGRSFIANGQSAVFSPFSVPSYVLPFDKSLAVVAIIKLFLGAFGMFLFARLMGRRPGGAFVSGLIFAFGTFFVIWLGWTLTSIFALIPWVLLLTELLVRRPEPLVAAGLAAVLGLAFLGGHPEYNFHLVFVTVCFFVFRAVLSVRRGQRTRHELWRPLIAFAAAGAAGAGLAALVLLPFAEFVLHSGDLSRRSANAASHWPAKYLGALFLHDYWGRPTQVSLAPFTQIRGWYAGALTLMLGGGALVARRTAERVGAALFAAFCTIVVVGVTPVFRLLTDLPGFSAAHNERMLIYVLVVLALLAGCGIDDLTDPGRPLTPRVRRLVLGLAGAIFCVPFVWMLVAGTLSGSQLGHGLRVAWLFEHPPLPGAGIDPERTVSAAIVRDSALWIWLPLAGAGFALLAWRLRRTRALGAGAFVALCAVLLAVDLFRANMGFNPAIRTSSARPPVTGAIRYLQSRRPNRFVGVSTAALTQPLPSDLAMDFGLYDARGYDYPVEKRFDQLWRGYVAPGVGDFTQPEEFASSSPAALRALSLLSVSDLLEGPLQAIRFPVRGPGISVGYKGKDAVVYSNARALPRTFVVDRQQTVPDGDAALRAVAAPGFDGRGVAVTERAIPGIAQGASGPPAAGASARLVRYEPERATIAATTPRRGLLVFTDTTFPGWEATVDGHPAPIERVDFVLRGVTLAPGHHVVEFRYRPASFRIGWIVSLVSLLAIAAAAAVGWRRRRRPA